MTESPSPAALSPAARRGAALLAVLASAAMLGVVAILVVRLAGSSPPREVTFLDGWDGDPSCHGPDYWTGRVAFTVCDWVYERRALVRFDPVRAEAKVLHRWQRDDGNTPSLRIARPCAGGMLFVIAETRQALMVVTDETDAVLHAVTVGDDHGGRVVGASCDDGAPQLFVEQGRERTGYVVLRLDGEALAPVRTIEPHGEVLGAWLQSGAWHVVLHRASSATETVFGPLDGALEPVAGRLHSKPCVLGGPGGWLECPAGRSPVVSLQDDELGVAPAQAGAVVVVGADGWLGATVEDDDGVRFEGLPAGELTMHKTDDAFVVERAHGGSSTIAGRRGATTLDIGARALPLVDGSVAIWGGLGERMVRVGPELERADALGPLARVLHPALRFGGGTTHLFDRLAYATILLLTPLCLGFVTIPFARRRRSRRRTQMAAIYLVAIVICGAGFLAAAEIV